MELDTKSRFYLVRLENSGQSKLTGTTDVEFYTY